MGALLLAAGILSIAGGLGLTAAVASGESTTVTLTSPTEGTSTTFTWSYVFNQNGGHELSNIAINFCTQDILDHVVSAAPYADIYKDSDVPGGHTGFGHGIKFAVTTATGTLSVTFDQPYAVGPGGISVQSHSGDGQDGDLVTTGFGPSCPGTTTTVTPTTVPVTTTVPPTTVPQVTTTVPPTTVPQVTTTAAPTTVAPTTVAPTTTTVPGGTLPTTTLPAVTTTRPAVTTTVASTTTTVAPTTTVPGGVLGVSERNPNLGDVAGNVGGVSGNLARTGSTGIPLLVGLGLVLIIVGLGLLAAEYTARFSE